MNSSRAQHSWYYNLRGEIKIKSFILVGYWWLTPIILASWEAEIRRIIVQGRPAWANSY
jgi:hypothetical protein